MAEKRRPVSKNPRARSFHFDPVHVAPVTIQRRELDMTIWLALAALTGGQAETPAGLDCAELRRFVADARAPRPFADFPLGPESRWPFLGLGGACSRGDDSALHCSLYRRGRLTRPEIAAQAVACLPGAVREPPPAVPRYHLGSETDLVRQGDVWLLITNTSPHTRMGYQVRLSIGRGPLPRD